MLDNLRVENLLLVAWKIKVKNNLTVLRKDLRPIGGFTSNGVLKRTKYTSQKYFWLRRMHFDNFKYWFLRGVFRCFYFQKQPSEVFCRKGVLREACNFIKKEALAQVFSCEFCEISKNTFFHRTPLVGASVFW